MSETKFRIWHHAGLTSCLSVRLHELCKYRKENGFLPDAVDFRDLFIQYRDFEGEDVNEKLMAPYYPVDKLPKVNFLHTWQFKWYKKINIPKISQLANVVCTPSELVMNKAKELMPLTEGRTAILYRGNDKGKEILPTPYEAMVEMAKETGNNKFIVQTDEEEFFHYFKEKFPDTIAFTEIPRIKRNANDFVLPTQGKRVEFAINFLAALVALSKCNTACIITGNIGLWFAIFRGNTKGIWQYNGKRQKFKKS